MAETSKSGAASSRKTGGANAPAETEAPTAADYPEDAQPESAADSLPDSTPEALATRGSEPRGEAEAADAGKVTIRLANPIDNKQDLQRLGLDATREGGYKVHDEVTLHPDLARVLISAGYAQVDPEDTKAVAEALSLNK